MAENIEVGDLVRLKSGGPLMTVASTDEADTHGVWCQWFRDDGTLESNYFKPPFLQPGDDAR